jgi:hypothetical protein
VAAVEQPQLAISYGSISSVKVARVSCQAARPPGNSPLRTHSVNGSVATGTASWRPVAASTAARISGVVRGVIRSSIVVTTVTSSSIQSSKTESTSPAMSRSTAFAAAPCQRGCRRRRSRSDRSRPAARRRAAMPPISRPGTVRRGSSADASVEDRIPATDLGRRTAPLRLPGPDRRDPLHGVREQSGRGHHPIDRALHPRPEQDRGRRSGRVVHRVALPRRVHRQPVRPGPSRGTRVATPSSNKSSPNSSTDPWPTYPQAGSTPTTPG